MEHRDFDERFTIEETANILGVGKTTIERWLDPASGPRIGHVLVNGRKQITAEQIDAFWRTSHQAPWIQPELPFEDAAS